MSEQSSYILCHLTYSILLIYQYHADFLFKLTSNVTATIPTTACLSGSLLIFYLSCYHM